MVRASNKSIFRVCYIYGIGTIGVYDLGTIPQYTMIDNCIIIFGLIYTFCAIVRSVIVRIIFSELSECLDGEEDVDIDSHYLIFAVLPMGTEFLDARKLFVIYLYSNLSVTSLANLAMMTLTISKALLNECHTTNITYMIGMICVAGFALTLGLLMFHSFDKRGIDELITGLDNTVLLLGMGKVALIMWVYGLNKFCTDINFWLGFSPTKYWTSCWATMPLLALFIYLYSAPGLQKALHMHYVTAIWYILIAIIIAVTSIRTFIVYMLRNNLTGVITTNPKYGPPEQEDRHLRKIFNETIRLRQCQHDCFLLDEIIDCNHMPIYKKSHTASTESLHSMTSLYQAKPSVKQESKHMLHLHT